MSHILQERTVRSIPELLRLRAEETPSKAAFRFPSDGDWGTVSWGEVHDQVRNVAAGLRSLGVENEDRVALLCSTRYEWVVADLAILAAGGATTAIYPSNTAEECAFIITDSDSRVVIVENEDQYNKVAGVRDELHDDITLVLIEGSIEGVLTLDDLAVRGAESVDEIDAVVDSIGPDDLATLIYTSGTTGRPKGVELTQDNWLYAAEGSSRVGILRSDDLHFLWLPLSHSFGKVLEILMIDAGTETAIDGRVDKIVENLAEIRPTLMAAAPRIFEKVHNVAVSSVNAEGGARAAIFKWAVKVGRIASERKAEGTMGRALALEYRIADKLVFSKLRERFGGRIRYFISGSAPLSQDLAEFFDAAGLTVLEGYGLTETSASTFVNPPDQPRFGTVGPAIPGTEVKIAEDGEVLLKSRAVMRGYRGLPEETAETLKDGWLYTGDIGELDDEGYLRITDRKKELIKTSGGKYVAPTKVESLIKSASPYISNALVHGDRRKFCVALVTLDPDAVGHWATEHEVENDPAVIAEHPEMIKLVEAAVDKANSDLASYETVKKVAILPNEFGVETGELTPSMKIKRRVVEQQNEELLDSMFADA